MIRLGEKQELVIIKQMEFGVYLADAKDVASEKAASESATAKSGNSQSDKEVQKVLLPIKQVPDGKAIGDAVEVFVYRDSKDRLIASTNMPKLTLHQVALLTVKQISKIGAFLDWGMEKDLLLPFAEQTARVREGEECLVALYIDKSDRLCATMNVYPYLRKDSTYKKEDRVSGTVYQISDNFGAFVAVDNRFSGLIPKKEMYGNVKIGDTIDARVTAVKEDGKLDLSIREKAYLQMGVDGEKIMALIDSYDGVLPFNDKVSPEIIRRETGMSKNEFKRAVGHLLKEGRIEIGEKVIRRV